MKIIIDGDYDKDLVALIKKEDLLESDTYFGILWDPEAQEFLEEVMVLIPKQMQNAARKGI